MPETVKNENKVLEPKPPFERVYEDNYFNVLRYLMKRLNHREDAEDLASEVFIYCYKNYESFDPGMASVKTWLYMVTSSRLKNYYRDHKDHDDILDFEDKLFSEETDMERAVYLKQLRDYIAEKLELLPKQQKDIVIMRYFRNMDYKDIAAEKGISQGNARVILSRALIKMEQYLTDSKFDWSE